MTQVNCTALVLDVFHQEIQNKPEIDSVFYLAMCDFWQQNIDSGAYLAS